MSRPRFNFDQRELIKQRYLSLESSEYIAANVAGTILDDGIPINGTTVRNTLRYMGVELRPAAHALNPVVTDEQRKRAVDMCRNGATRPAAAKALGVSVSTVEAALKDAGVHLPIGKPRTCTVNDAAFDVLTPEALYWAGFIWADGCLHQDVIKRPRKNPATAGSPALCLGLSVVDRKHLEKLRDFLGSTHKISNRPPRNSQPVRKGGPAIKTGPTCYYSVRSKRLVAALSSLGIATKRPSAPSAAVTSSRDFWRGAVDGDGHVDNDQRYPAINLSGTLLLIEEFCRYLVRQGLTQLVPFEGDGVWIAGTTGSTARAIAEHLYDDAVEALDRKLECVRAMKQGRACSASVVTRPPPNADDALAALLGTPFPLPPQLLPGDIQKELGRLRDLQIDTDEAQVIKPYSRVGLDICAPAFPNRYAARRKGGVSALIAWQDEEEMRKAIEFQLSHGDPVEPHRVLRAITLRCRTPTIFRPGVAKFIYERYCPRGGSVWDPCSGYGGRLLGAHVAGVCYIGTDVDEETVEGNRKVAATIGSNATLHLAAAEAFDPGSIDLVFTSPPYFDREAYSEAAKQSWMRYGDLRAWLDGFLRPVIQRAHNSLRVGAHLVLNIADLNERGRVVPLVAKTIETALACGFDHVDTLQMPLAAINRKSPTEPILVFKRKSAAP